MSNITTYIWGGCNSLWLNGNWTWSEMQLVTEILSNFDGVDASTLIQPWLIEPWNPYKDVEKRKRLIKLICKVRGEEYDVEKELKSFKVDIEDIKLVVKTITNINLDTKIRK